MTAYAMAGVGYWIGWAVAYLFEPFMGVYGGFYDEGTDSVAGKSGFTSWDPEVLCWFPLPA